MEFIKNKSLLILFISLATLIIVYISEYGFGLEPCVLCKYERVPYFIAIFISIFWFFNKKSKIAPIIISVTFFASSTLALYHVGVEKGIFKGLESCSALNYGDNLSSIEDMRKIILENKQASCSVSAYNFLGISMAGWNFVVSFIAFIITIYGRKNEQKT